MKKMAAFAGVACAVPQVFGKKNGIDKYLTDGPNPKSLTSNVFYDKDGTLHCPVVPNYLGYTTWDKKDFHSIVADIQYGVYKVQELALLRFNPSKDKFAILIPPSKAIHLKKKNKCWNDVESYVRYCFPNVYLEYRTLAMQLENSGLNGTAEFLVGWMPELTYMSDLFCFGQYGI